jgi:dihydroflavonol-4-reductase
MWLAKVGAPLATLFDRVRGNRPLFTPISLRELESNPLLSHEKASRELGYQPRPLEQAIADTMGWFRSHGFLN